MKLRIPLSSISGILVIIFYCVFTFTAVALFPPPFSPIHNYLSDLGNSTYSPQGAIFYNIGCILTGATLFPFFIGLYKWFRDETWHKILMIVIIIIGCYSGLALIMIGVFNEDFLAQHIYWSNVFFFLNLIVLILTSIALYTHLGFIKIIAFYGIIVAIINLLFVFVIGSSILEWFTVFTALGFVALIVYNMYKIFK